MNERRDINIDLTDIKRIIMWYYELLQTNKLDDLYEIDIFLGRYKYSTDIRESKKSE